MLGLGFPTLIPDNGVTAMTVADVKGVKLAGLMFDAGPVNSPVLLEVGDDQHAHKSDAERPDDAPGRVLPHRRRGRRARRPRSLVVNSDNVILDDIWAWRADHGNGVGWTVNTADTGVVVNGDNVTAYGLFVEHYQKYDVIWNGESGRTIFFQNEMPYDPPNQAAWTHDGVNGFAAYKVADAVKTHEAWGLGSYCFFNVDPSIHADPRLRGAGHAGREAARPAHRLPRRRRHDRPRRQRHRRRRAGLGDRSRSTSSASLILRPRPVRGGLLRRDSTSELQQSHDPIPARDRLVPHDSLARLRTTNGTMVHLCGE